MSWNSVQLNISDHAKNGWIEPILLIRDMAVDGGTDDLAVKPYILQKISYDSILPPYLTF